MRELLPAARPARGERASYLVRQVRLSNAYRGEAPDASARCTVASSSTQISSVHEIRLRPGTFRGEAERACGWTQATLRPQRLGLADPHLALPCIESDRPAGGFRSERHVH